MPKPKNKKNPYIYFCLERKQSEQKYQGKSLRELVELCNAEWTQMSKFCCVFNYVDHVAFLTRNLSSSSIDYFCVSPKKQNIIPSLLYSLGEFFHFVQFNQRFLDGSQQIFSSPTKFVNLNAGQYKINSINPVKILQSPATYTYLSNLWVYFGYSISNCQTLINTVVNLYTHLT